MKEKRIPTWQLRDMTKRWADNTPEGEYKNLLYTISQRLEQHRQLRKKQSDFQEEKREFYVEQDEYRNSHELEESERELVDCLKRFISANIVVDSLF